LDITRAAPRNYYEKETLYQKLDAIGKSTSSTVDVVITDQSFFGSETNTALMGDLSLMSIVVVIVGIIVAVQTQSVFIMVSAW
jgi:hypothetical protein